MNIDNLSQPILILDTDRCKRNIRRMAEKAKTLGCDFRPHFKTHQSAVVGEWFRDNGVKAITVSSTSMAAYFSDHGWSDITIAFPFFPSQLTALSKLQQKCRLRLFVNSPGDVMLLSESLKDPIRVYIELDTGYARSGVYYKNENEIDAIIGAADATENITFHGFYVHDGGTYRKKGDNQIRQQITPTLSIFHDLSKKYPKAKFSLGDTPSASVLTELNSVDELTPGNFVFYDWMQVQIGSCELDDVALFAALPVAQVNPERKQAILHGGAVHLSKEYLAHNGQANFGQVIEWKSDSPVKINSFISSVSQEHGILSTDSIDKTSRSVLVCPIHSCLTANLHSHYITQDGKRIEKRILS